jgi:hypothetical protein
MIKLAKTVKEHNTDELNQICLIEESAELIQAICKIFRKRNSNIEEEISHVSLMIGVMILQLNIPQETIEHYAYNAVSRQKMKQCTYHSEQTGCIYCTQKCFLKEDII